MTLLTSTVDVGGILPPEYGQLVLEPIQAQALAMHPDVATVVTTNAHDFHVPIIREDAGAAWLTEGAEITPDDPTLDEIVVTPAKVGGLTIISRELARDSSPAAQALVGESIGRSIAVEIDRAFFTTVAPPAPDGLNDLPITDDDPPVEGITAVAAGGYTNLDAFAEAIAAVEAHGGTVTAFVTSPATALALAKVKTATGSNAPLLGPDGPTEGTRRRILGVPLHVSARVPTGTTWALDRTGVYTVLREGVQLAVSNDAYFSSDRIGVRATARIGFAFPIHGRIAKIS